MDQVHAHMRTLARSDQPILVGPWLSEVGFELLYWIPFLRYAIAHARIDKKRLWIVSRGGCRSWYAGLTSNYLELYDLYTPSELHALNRQRIREQAIHGQSVGLRRGQVTAKQYYYSSVEKLLVAQMSARAGLTNLAVLHPSLMYAAFRLLWRRHGDLYGRWGQMTLVSRLQAPPVLSGLPASYVAMKFYASEACADLPETRATIQRAVRTIADSVDVVLLHTKTAYDEHGEFDLPTHPRIHRLTFTPKTNLDEQTAVIAGASGFVGTYGGFAYLAPFLGVPTLALYARRNFRKDHLRLMQDVAARRLCTPFRVTTTADALTAIRRDRREWMPHAA